MCQIVIASASIRPLSFARLIISHSSEEFKAVSYTHLDVYKRQTLSWFALLLYGINRNFLSVLAQLFKLHGAGHQCIQGIVRADAYIGAGVNMGAALAIQNVAGQHELTVDVYKRQW